MARLYLQFEQTVLKEFPLAHEVITIGRLPDNVVQVDNPAVSGHHAKITWENDHYVVDDCASRNGTFVNGQAVSRTALRDGDQILVCKHTLLFEDEKQKPVTATVANRAAVPHLEETVVLDTRKMKEMLAGGAAAGAAAAAAAGAAAAPAMAAPTPNGAPKQRVGLLT